MTDKMTAWSWTGEGEQGRLSWTCGVCEQPSSSKAGWYGDGFVEGSRVRVYILTCAHCGAPAYFLDGQHEYPRAPYGPKVIGLPEGIAELWSEARNCVAVGAFTSAVLACRKILMNVAVREVGADEGKTFVHYVDALNDAGHVPPGGKPWVDRIRGLGNEATHEIAPKSEDDARLALDFTAGLLQFIYEFPARLSA